MARLVLLVGWVLAAFAAAAEGLGPEQLAVVYNRDDPVSVRVAQYYAAHRKIPAANLVGLPVPDRATIGRDDLKRLRTTMLDALPTRVQSLLLVWSRPYAVECMSVTTAFAAGYAPAFCEPGCDRTLSSRLFDSSSWLPADTIGWLPAMLLPTFDETLAYAVIDRGIASDGTRPRGTVYLARTRDAARSVRAAGYPAAMRTLAGRIKVQELDGPVDGPVNDVVGYFTGATWVAEIPRLTFRPGAVADHLTSVGGVLEGVTQMPALRWLKQGATGSYGTVSEPCNHLGKFPNPAIFFDHYLRGDTLLEAYWKSVEMPGQGLFIGEPLARPYPP